MLYELTDEQVEWLVAVADRRGEAPNPDIIEALDNPVTWERGQSPMFAPEPLGDAFLDGYDRGVFDKPKG
jgi:hypothetical protein